MGKIIEVDAISDAIIETEREIAGEAWGVEDTERDVSGQSLEALGEGLEGQHETEDEDEPEGEEADGEEESEVEVEVKPELVKAEVEAPKPPVKAEAEKGVVPSRVLREANDRARAAETETARLQAELAKAGDTKTLADKLDLALREIDNLKRAPRTEPKAVEPPKVEAVPDIFEDPKGFAEYMQKGFQTELAKRDVQLDRQRVETSMAIAHSVHKDAFSEAFTAINRLDRHNPDDRALVQKIYESPNPGEALVGWHKRSKTLALVGDDPTAYAEKIRTETRDALMKDPEFRKALLADLRGEASRGDDGSPRTVTRLPKSLAAAPGSNLGAERSDPHEYDNSDRAVSESAWR